MTEQDFLRSDCIKSHFVLTCTYKQLNSVGDSWCHCADDDDDDGVCTCSWGWEGSWSLSQEYTVSCPGCCLWLKTPSQTCGMVRNSYYCSGYCWPPSHPATSLRLYCHLNQDRQENTLVCVCVCVLFILSLQVLVNVYVPYLLFYLLVNLFIHLFNKVI